VQSSKKRTARRRVGQRTGEISRELETHERTRTDLADNGGRQTKTKEQTLADAGISTSTANRCEDPNQPAQAQAEVRRTLPGEVTDDVSHLGPEPLMSNPQELKAAVAHGLEEINQRLGLDTETFRQIMIELIGPWRAETAKDKQAEPQVDLIITD
jgi:hypothetical protein